MNKKNRFVLFIVIVIVIAAALRFWSLGWGLPLIQHAGELAALKKPLGLAGPVGIKPFGVWSVPFDLHFFIGKLSGLFADYLDYQAVFLSDPLNVALIGRATAAVFSVGVCLLLFEAGRLLARPKAGLCAALLWAVSPLAVREAHLALPVNLSIFFALLSLYFVIRLKSAFCFDARWTAAAGLCAGFSAVTAPAPVFVLMTLFAALILFMMIRVFKGKNSPAEFSRPFLFALGGSAAGLLLGCTLIVICPPCLFKTSVFGPPTEITNPLLYYPWAALHVLDRATIGFLLAGGLFAVLRKNTAALGLLGFGFLGYLILFFSRPPHFEEVLFVLPALLLGGAIGIESVFEGIFKDEKKRVTAFTAVVVLTALFPFYQSVQLDQILRAPSTVELARDWITQNISLGSRVAELPDGLRLSEGRDFVTEIDLSSTNDVVGVLRENNVEWVVIHSSGIVLETQTRPVQCAASKRLMDYLDVNAVCVYSIAPCLTRNDENLFGECPEREHFNYVLPLRGLGRAVRPGPVVAVYRIEAGGRSL